MTQTGTVLGTSNYLSPEQASGKRRTPSTDVYSLGVVLYELLTAEVPFPGENFVAVAMKHINEPPPDLLRSGRTCRSGSQPRSTGRSRRIRLAGSRRWTQFAWELRQCLAELDAPDAERTFIAPSPVLKQSRPHRARAARSRAPLYLIVALPRSPRSSSACSRSAARRASRRSSHGRDRAPVHARRYRRRRSAGRQASNDSDAPRRRMATRRRSGARSTTRRRQFGKLEERRRASCSTRAGPVALKSITVATRHARLHGPDPRRRLAAGPFAHPTRRRSTSARSTTFALTARRRATS